MDRNKHNPVGWFEIYVNDINRAKKFYEGVFNVKLEKLETPMPNIIMYAFPGTDSMENYGAHGAIVQMEGISAGIGGTLVYFSCDDCEIEQGKVEKNGGQVIHPKFSIGEYGFYSMVSDSEGNMIGLHSFK